MCSSVLCPARPMAWHQAPLDWTLFHPVQGPPYYTTTSSLPAKPCPALSLSPAPPQAFPPRGSQAPKSLFPSSFYPPLLGSTFCLSLLVSSSNRASPQLSPLTTATCAARVSLSTLPFNNHLHVHTSQTSTFGLHGTWAPCSQLFVRHFYLTYLLAKWSSTCLKPTQWFTQWLLADCSRWAVCCLSYWRDRSKYNPSVQLPLMMAQLFHSLGLACSPTFHFAFVRYSFPPNWNTTAQILGFPNSNTLLTVISEVSPPTSTYWNSSHSSSSIATSSTSFLWFPILKRSALSSTIYRTSLVPCPQLTLHSACSFWNEDDDKLSKAYFVPSI